MVLRDAVLARGITRRSIKGADGSLARHAALKLAPDFLRAALFQRIGASTRDKRESAHNRQGFHLLMLRSDRANARRVEATILTGNHCGGVRRGKRLYKHDSA
jgi:hypothetical protein